MKLEVSGKVKYRCTISNENAIKLLDYSKQHGISLEDAVWALYESGIINIYDMSDEIDYSTEGILVSELEENEEEYYNLSD